MTRVFTSWADELARFKNALAAKEVDSFWIMSTENSREMRTVYTRLGNVTQFIEWLEMKATLEAETNDGTSGGLLTSVGGA